MTLFDLINDFLLYVLHERRLSKNTHKAYQSQLRYFLHWLEDNGYPAPTADCLNLPVLRRFLYYLSGKSLRPRTILSYFDPMSSFCVYLIENGLLKENPVKSLTLPKKDAAKRLTVSNEEVAGLLVAVERDRNPRRVALNRAVLNVLIFGGLRRAEVCDLYLTDIDFANKALLVRSGKGGKSRTVYLPDSAVAAIREYLTFRPKDCLHSYLFAIDRQRRMWHHGLQALLEDVKTTAGYAGRENIKPHSLRHWRATDLMRAGADLKSVSAFLGHSQLQTTSIYLHTSEEQCRSISELTTAERQGETASNGSDRQSD